MGPRALAAAFAFVLAFALVRSAAAAEGGKSIHLYTIGPGDYFYSRYGHSLLCARDAGAADPAEGTARCYDYGIADSQDFVHIFWTAIRAQPAFVPVVVEERVVLEVFRGEGRSLDRQHLPLSADEAARLVERMETDVRERRAYAYHPYWANCTTQLRDRIDEATGGRLRAGRSTPATARFREIVEEGMSGRLGELTMLALLLGAPNDRVPDPWEVMFLPTGLRDAVAERLGAPVEKVAERQAVILPTSRAVGRVALFVLALALFGTIRLAARLGRLRHGLFVVGFVLGTLGCVTVLVAALVTWPEISRNWALALLLPTDLALPYLPRRWLAVYARARVAGAVVVAVLELVGIIAQPLLPLVALVAMPLGTLLGVLRSESASIAPSETTAL